MLFERGIVRDLSKTEKNVYRGPVNRAGGTSLPGAERYPLQRRTGGKRRYMQEDVPDDVGTVIADFVKTLRG